MQIHHVSSDYVYDGQSNVPYSENVTPNPSSAYGRSKLAGEKYALLHQGSMIIRTSWLYSSFGNNFVKTILRHGAEKESLNVVFDQPGPYICCRSGRSYNEYNFQSDQKSDCNEFRHL